MLEGTEGRQRPGPRRALVAPLLLGAALAGTAWWPDAALRVAGLRPPAR